MAILWRLVPARHADKPLSGEGARLNGGRWNEIGTSVIYTSEHRSLAALEVLVHLNGTNPINRYKLLSYELHEKLIQEIAASELPRDWRQEPPPYSTAQWGTEWAKKKASVAVAVPSAVIPEEKNIILNTEHPDFGKVTPGTATNFVFDPRLFSSTGAK
jgi:RES domain-containing protein